jgi:hypothetical protein
MRRLFAHLALAAFFSNLLSPLAVTLQSSGTPLCCLPGGKHHCRQSSAGLGFKSQNDKCPYALLTIATQQKIVGADNFDLVPLRILDYFDLVDVQSALRFTTDSLSARGPPEFFF